MWHEVRKQERRIRCMIVDYKRRAERRKDYYEKIKADPTQFLQIHGRPCKIHLDPAVAMAGDSPANMMGWQGSPDVVIDRFDVRAHLDYIPDYKGEDDEPLSYEDRNINYERYRILVQNDFLGVSEEKFLHQLYLEEQFGAVTRMPEVPNEGKKKVQGAAIGFNYDDPTANQVPPQPAQEPEPEDDEEEDEDSDIDFDVCVDVNKVTTPQAHEMNSNALPYGMESNDFFSFLTKDREEAETLRMAKELEEEKAMYSGRKSRRERRAYREKKLAGRIISPPSYASRKSPTYRDYTKEGSKSRSRSNSPVNAGKITYITSFGGEEVPQPSCSSPKLKSTPKTLLNEYSRSGPKPKSRSPDIRRRRSRSRSHSPHSSRRRRTKSRSPRNSWRKSPKRTFNRKTVSRSRSPKPGSSRSLVRSHSRSKSPARNNNKVLSATPVDTLVKQPPPPVISRYYGRRGQSSSSELSVSDEETDKSNSNNSVKKVGATIGNASSRNKPAVVPSTSAVVPAAPKLTPQERLKRKMQALINKQYKADKRAEREKREKVEQERIDREDEMREISIKLRKRERMRRHEYLAEYDRRRSDASDSSNSRSSSRSRSRSKSQSPRRRDRDRERRRRSRSHSRTSGHSKTSGHSRDTRSARDRDIDVREREKDYDVRDRERDYDPRDREKDYDVRDRERDVRCQRPRKGL
uniref:CLK4-associating serine/arginine rich protein n=3 Tax=Lygus hesperus TaxID=30085 RepID=A0A0A9XD10_LYGHE